MNGNFSVFITVVVVANCKSEARSQCLIWEYVQWVRTHMYTYAYIDSHNYYKYVMNMIRNENDVENERNYNWGKRERSK